MKNKFAMIVAILLTCVAVAAIIFFIPHKAKAVLKIKLSSVQSAEITYHPIGDNPPLQLALSESETAELIEAIEETKIVFKSLSKQSIWDCPSYKVILYTQDALKSSNKDDSISFTIGEDGSFSLDRGTYKVNKDSIYELLDKFTAQQN